MYVFEHKSFPINSVIFVGQPNALYIYVMLSYIIHFMYTHANVSMCVHIVYFLYSTPVISFSSPGMRSPLFANYSLRMFFGSFGIPKYRHFLIIIFKYLVKRGPRNVRRKHF